MTITKGDSASGLTQVLCAGDVIPARSFATSEVSSEVWQSFADSDHVFVNLETVLTTSLASVDKVACVRCNPDLAAELVGAHMDVVTMANNHSLDFGWEGLADTCRAIDQAGLCRVGAGSSLAEALAPAVLSTNNYRTVAFLGLSATLPLGSAASETRPGVAPLRISTQYVIDAGLLSEDPARAPFVRTTAVEPDLETACHAVREAKREADAVIVALHWGSPTGLLPRIQGWLATYQQPVAHRLIDAGADAIIGHHPHTLHGVESYRGRPIYYSLGNLLFHSLETTVGGMRRPEGIQYDWSFLAQPEFKIGGVADLRIDADGVAHAGLRFVVLDDGDPRWATPIEAEAAFTHVVDLSKRFGTDLVMGSDTAWIGAPPAA